MVDNTLKMRRKSMLNAMKECLLIKELWSFSVARYASPAVQAQLLAWQEQNNANVNLAIVCVWAGHRGRRLMKPEIRHAVEAVSGWNSAVTSALRSMRRRLKGEWSMLAADPEPARQAILAAELEAERTEQALLIKALSPWPAPVANADPALAATNLATYLGGAATAAPASTMAAICSSE